VFTPFTFLQLPGPYSRFNLRRSRTPRPDAIVSMSRKMPMILNCTGAVYGGGRRAAAPLAR
jgi:hypothetical protein